MPTTEVLFVSTRHGRSPALAMETLRGLSTVSSVSWGFDLDDPNVLLALIDWDSREAYEDFVSSSAFSPFLEEFAAIRSASPSIWHVDFRPSTEAQHKVLNAPVAEIVTFHFAGPLPGGFLHKALDFRTVLSEQPGFVELSVGVAFEDVDFQGTKGRVVIALVGWETKEHFERFRDSDTLKERNPGVGLPEESLVGRHMRVVKLYTYGAV